MQSNSCFKTLRAMVMAGMLAAGPPAIAAAQPQQAPRPLTMTVTARDGAPMVTLKAEDARLVDLAAELGKRLQATVTVGPSLRQQRVTTEVAEAPLEAALGAVVARVLVDYEIRQNLPPIPRTVYLLGFEDPEPLLNTTERGVSVGLMISGHTEDVAPAPENDPLLIVGDKQSLSVTIRQQPLAAVALAASELLGVPADVRYEAAELVDLDVKNATAEDVLPRISPNLGVIVRVDPGKGERKLVRLVVDRLSARR